MSAWFYWDALKRYWWLVILPVVVISAAIIGLENARGPQFQSTLFFLVNSPYTLTTREYSRSANSRQSGVSDDQISSVFDFTNLANSLQVASKTIRDLNLPVAQALDLLKPPLFDLKSPSVKITPGTPAGDAASQGFLTEILGLQASDPSKLQALSRWVQLTAFAYDPAQAEQIARTYANNAVDLFKTVQTQAATMAQQQTAEHAQAARHQYDAAGAELAAFERKHQLLNGGAEFQSAQSALESLRQERTGLVAGVGGHAITEKRLVEIGSEIEALEQELNRLSAEVGEAQAVHAGRRAAAEAEASAAQTAYSQVLQTYSAAEKEFSLARAQGFPSTQVSHQTSESSGAESTAVTTEQQPASTTITSQTQNSHSITTVQEQPGHKTTSQAEQTASEDLVTTIESTARTETEGEDDTSTSTEESSTQKSTIPAANRATTTTTTTTLPDIKTSSTTTFPSTTSSSTTTTPPRTVTSTATTNSKPVTTSITIEAPTPIQSEEQGLEYVFRLGLSVDQSSAQLKRAQQQLAAVEASDPTATLNSQLSAVQEEIAALRSARSALLRVEADPVAGLEALDKMIADQERRVEFLTTVAPEYRRLSLNVQRTRATYEEALQLADLYSRLRSDASTSAGVHILDAPYTMRVPGKLPLVLTFGILAGLLFGISLAFTVAYIVHLRSLDPPPGAIRPELNGTGSEGEHVPAYASTVASPSGKRDTGLPSPG